MESHEEPDAALRLAEYPAPPRVHWIVLLVVLVASELLVDWVTSIRYQLLLESLLADAWVFYLCRWIRRLNPDSYSWTWCDIYIVVNLAFAATQIRQNPSTIFMIVQVVLAFATDIIGVALIFIIRADLLKHYNEREPYGLKLSGVMTFFFSLIYFQYHLYGIATQKRQEVLNALINPRGTSVP